MYQRSLIEREGGFPHFGCSCTDLTRVPNGVQSPDATTLRPRIVVCDRQL